MLIQPRGPRARYFTQHDHGIFTGQLAHAWDLDLPMESVLTNTLHDLAWEPLDDLSTGPIPFDPARGALHDFITLPKADKMALYAAGLDALERVHPYAGLLISLHYSVFFPRDPDTARYHAREDARRARLSATLGLSGDDDPDLQRDYAWLKFFDVVSLYACLAQPGADEGACPRWLGPSYTVEGRHYTFSWDGPDTLVIDPFDARGHAPILARIPYRELDARPFADAEALRRAWLDAPVQVWELTARGR